MRFLKPTPIVDALLVSSSVAETDFAAWSAATTYALGDKCISTTSHRIYESTQAANLNHAPTTDTGAWWIDIGPTNRWAMFDQTVGTITSGSTPLSVTLAPGIINGLALLDVSATTVTVTMTDGAAGPTVFSGTYDMGDTVEILDWYMYFFEPIIPLDTLIVENIPPYANGYVTVALAAATTSYCGTLAVGVMIDVGSTTYGASVGIIDYSKKETNIFGITSVIERAYAKRIESRVVIDNARLDYVARQLAAIRAMPCVWAADNGAGYSSLVAYGFYKDWRITIAYPHHSETSLTIEGLT